MHIHSLPDTYPVFRAPVLTIGTFDGVHHGHQEIFQRMKDLAEAMEGETIVLTFHPHPRLVLHPEDGSLHLLSTLQEKKELMARYGIDHLVIANFSQAFAQTTPREYIKSHLVERMMPQVIAIGYDHRFGHNRSGGLDDMMLYGKEFGYRVEEIPKQQVDAVTVSSTRIRQAIEAGQMGLANLLLGHPYFLTGYVGRGYGVGKGMGFPTANITITDPHKLIPEPGIYAARTRVFSRWYKSLLYIGTRPTFQGNEQSIEVHLMDFDGNLYDQLLQIEVIKEIRNDLKFDSKEALREQMLNDREVALDMLSNQG